jgi:putative FmdB family regulatory protein
MPSYSFQCPVCGKRFTRTLSFNADLSKVVCPNGHGQVERIYVSPPVVFKGHGYYVTDSHSHQQINNS